MLQNSQQFCKLPNTYTPSSLKYKSDCNSSEDDSTNDYKQQQQQQLYNNNNNSIVQQFINTTDNYYYCQFVDVNNCHHQYAGDNSKISSSSSSTSSSPFYYYTANNNNNNNNENIYVNKFTKLENNFEDDQFGSSIQNIAMQDVCFTNDIIQSDSYSVNNFDSAMNNYGYIYGNNCNQINNNQFGLTIQPMLQKKFKRKFKDLFDPPVNLNEPNVTTIMQKPVN